MRVPTSISRKVASASLQASKNAPSLLFGAGVVGMIGSTVLACRATLKLDEHLQRTQHDLKIAVAANADEPDKYTDADLQQDKLVIVSRSVIGIAKLYGPAVMVGVVSIGCLTKSKNLLQSRNEALAAAYVAVDQAFNQYRGRVIEKYGEDEDRELRYGAEDREVWDETKGKMTKGKAVGSDIPSQYSRFFDEFSTSWNNNAEYNFAFIRCQQNYANDMLRAKGHLFLNEVYDMLGLERSSAGAVVGWKLGHGDDFVDFGVFDGEMARHFVNGREGSILLDFNVDGLIYNLIDNPEDGKPWQS